MGDRYLRKIIRRNWKTLVILIVILIITGFTVKNIGEIPYEDRYMLNSTYPLEFEHQGKTIRGFIYADYWVTVEQEEIEGMSEVEIDDYLFDHGYINLGNKKDKIIAKLKTYSMDKIKENWYNDVDFILKNNPYFISNDPELEKSLKKLEFNVDIQPMFKKVVFVYMQRGEFGEYMERLKENNTDPQKVENIDDNN